MAEGLVEVRIDNFVGGYNTEDDIEIGDNQMADGSKNVIAIPGKTNVRKGYAKEGDMSSLGSKSITSIFDGVNDILVSASDGVVYERTGAGAYTSRDTGRANSAHSWVSYNAKDINFDGANTPRQWNGTTFSDLTNAPSADAAVIFRDHVFALDRDSAELVFSEQGDETSWPSENGIQIDKNTREKNRAFVVASDRIVVFKQRSIWHVAGDDKLNFARFPVSHGIGCVHHAAVQVVDGSPNPRWNGIYWVDQGGIYFSPDLGASVVRLSDLPGASIQTKFDGLAFGSIDDARVGIVRKLNQVWFLLTNGTYNDTVYVWDYKQGIWQPENTAMNFSAIEEVNVSGEFLTWTGEANSSTGGFIYEVNSGTDDAGSAIAAEIRTKRFDFGRPIDQLKTLEKLQTIHNVFANDSWSVDAYYDFSSVADDTQTIAMSSDRGFVNYNKAVGVAQFGIRISDALVTSVLRRLVIRARPMGPPSD